MATFNNTRLYDKTVICPYNSAHIISELGLAKHLVRCEKQYPEIRLKKCPYNATHRIREEDFRDHLMECVDKDIVDSKLIVHKDDNRIKGALAVPAYEHPQADDGGGENWDDELPDHASSTFDPTLNKSDKVRFFDVTKHTIKSKKERLAMYNKLHMEQGNDQPRAEITTQSSSKPSASKNKQHPSENTSKPAEVRRPRQEALSEHINQPFIGLGRGKRIAANLHNQIPQATFNSNSFPIQNSESIPQQFEAGRGRALFTNALRNKPVSVPPGFERVNNNNNAINGNKNILKPLAEGEIKTINEELDPEKQRRKLEKKIKQINALIQKQDNGCNLSQEEIEKVSKLKSIEKELQKLSLE